MKADKLREHADYFSSSIGEFILAIDRTLNNIHDCVDVSPSTSITLALTSLIIVCSSSAMPEMF